MKPQSRLAARLNQALRTHDGQVIYRTACREPRSHTAPLSVDRRQFQVLRLDHGSPAGVGP